MDRIKTADGDLISTGFFREMCQPILSKYIFAMKKNYVPIITDRITFTQYLWIKK